MAKKKPIVSKHKTKKSAARGGSKKRPALRTLSTEQETRAFLHPVRSRILRMLAPQAMTISQVAGKLGVHPANLTHQFRRLVQAGLIDLVEERDIGRVVEKYYRAIADRFEVRADEAEDPASLRGAGARALGLLKERLNSAQRTLPEEELRLLCLLGESKIASRDFERFCKKLERLMAEFRTRDTNQGEQYSLVMALFPETKRRSARRSPEPGKKRAGEPGMPKP